MAFTGQLRANEIFGSLYNMLISQHVFSDNITNSFSDLLNSARVDGSMFGDTKVYYATDVNKTIPWGGDREAANLLALNRPADPEQQAIYLDQFRMVFTTVDNYLTKRAWMDEGSFGQFQAVTLAWLQDTKKVYETTLYNSYIGTVETAADRAIVDIDLSDAQAGDPLYGLNGNEKAEMEGKLIAQSIADLIVDMKDVSRDFNDYGFLRAYDEGRLKFIFNSAWANKLRKVDLPGIFHNEGLVDKLTDNILPARYFGHVVTKSDAATDTTRFTVSGNDITIKAGIKDVRSLIETDYTVGGTVYHVFPGDIIPAGATFTETTSIQLPGKVGGTAAYTIVNTAYVEDPDVICKVMIGNAVPFMSAFEVSTSFYNPRSLTENHYLIFAHNTLQYLYNLPLITVEKD